MYYITQADGSRVPLEEGGILDGVETLLLNTTLRIEDSGKTFILGSVTGRAILLPAVTVGKGWQYKFITGLAFSSVDWTVTSTTNKIQGNVLVDGTQIPGVNENTISFVATAESIGDYVDVISDGVNIYVSGSGVTTGSITLTVV